VYEYVYEYGKKLRECAPLVLLNDRLTRVTGHFSMK